MIRPLVAKNAATRRLLRTATLTALLGAAPCRAQDCQPYWSAPVGLPSSNNITDLLEFDDGTGRALYAGGGFGIGSGAPAVWRRRQGAWEPVGSGLLGASILRVLDDGSGPALYALIYREPPPSYTLKRWTGTAWVDAPPGMLVWHNQPPGGLPGDVAPHFSGSDADGPGIFGVMLVDYSVHAVVRWNGQGWTQLGPNMSGSFSSLWAIYDSGNGPQVHTTVGSIWGTSIISLARWNGQAWEQVGGLTPGFQPTGTRALCVFNDGSGPALYLASAFGGTHNIFDQCIVRWNGTAWSSVGGGVSTTPGGSYQVDTLAVFDDGSGSGPELYAAGVFTVIGGVQARDIAKWNGQRWAPLGQGIGAYVDAMGVADDIRGRSLFLGGSFQTVGGGLSPRIAQYVGCPSCYANCDLSTTPPTLNVADFTCFLRAFAARDPYANCNVDQTIDVADFVCYITKFTAGCPSN